VMNQLNAPEQTANEPEFKKLCEESPS